MPYLPNLVRRGEIGAARTISILMGAVGYALGARLLAAAALALSPCLQVWLGKGS